MEESISQEKRTRTIYKVTWVGFGVNALLSLGKLVAGIVGKSSAMVADAVHSISDFATDLIVLLFVKVSAKPQDQDHDYGHGKYETLATTLIGVVLMLVAVGIFYNGIVLIGRVIRGETIAQPGLIALIAAAVSIGAKEGLYWYTVLAAKNVNSQTLRANAWHHRSDALSSLGTLIGIGGAYFLSEKWRILDPIASLIVGCLIFKVAYDLIKPSLDELTEHSLPAEQEQDILNIALADERLSDVHHLKTRRIGNGIAVEFHIRVNPEMTVAQADVLTKDIEHRLCQKYGPSTQVIIHVEPIK